MLCLSTSEQEIEDALGNMKATFCNNAAVTDETANREQCVKALKTAVETLAKIKKDGKRTLNKDENIDLKKEIVDAYKELTRLQGYSGLDKAQKCFEFAEKWRGVVSISEPGQPQQQTPIHESGRFVHNISISSGGSHSIPDQFYQADVASSPSEIDIFEEDNLFWNSPGSSKVDLDVLRIDEPSEDQDGPREQYGKHTGWFADAAPRMEHSNEDVDEGLLSTTSTSVEGNREDPVKDGILNPVTPEATSAAPPQETRMPVIDDVKGTPASPTSENNNGQSEISEVRNVQVIARVQALYDFEGEDRGDLPFKVGDIINVIEYLDDNWWRGIHQKNVGIFPTSYVQQLRLPANGKYPTINVRIRIINGRSTEGLLTGDLPPVDQGQLVGSQDEVLTSQPLPYILPPLDLSPAAGSGAYMLNQQPDIYTPAIMGGAPVAGSQGYALSQQPFPYIPPPPDGSPVARPSSPPAPLLRPATLPLQTSGYFPPPP